MKKIFLLVCCLGLFSCVENAKKQDSASPSPSVVASIPASPVASTSPVASASTAPSASSSAVASPSGSASPANTTQIPNPASVYCIDQGGKLDIRNETGGQVGYCMFEENNVKSECEEWAFFRGDCKKGQNKK